jgi:hypothetical protein
MLAQSISLADWSNEEEEVCKVVQANWDY